MGAGKFFIYFGCVALIWVSVAFITYAMGRAIWDSSHNGVPMSDKRDGDLFERCALWPLTLLYEVFKVVLYKLPYDSTRFVLELFKSKIK